MKIEVHGLDRLKRKIARMRADLPDLLERAGNQAAERLRDEVAAQPWGAGNRQFPVDTGALRDSGRVAGTTLIWDDLEYAGIIEARGGGFFGPIVAERGEEILAEELRHEVDALTAD